jgi:hypothetical protein
MLEHEREREQWRLSAVAELLLCQGCDAALVKLTYQVERGATNRHGAVHRLFV